MSKVKVDLNKTSKPKEKYEDFRLRILLLASREPSQNPPPVVVQPVLTGTVHKSVKLYYTNDAENSDKVYELEIVRISETQSGVPKNPAQFYVQYAYGKRGGPLRKGRVTDSPVSLQDATKLYMKTLAEKVSKGYTEDVSGKPFA